jgi:hypothetical protein
LPLSVVSPNEVVPPLLTIRSAELPDTVRLPPEVRLVLPVTARTVERVPPA